MNADKFEKWFKEQFGSLPSSHRPIYEIARDLQKAERLVNFYESELLEAQLISAQYKAASYTKNAVKNRFKF